MVGVIELESMTSTMSTWRSNQLSYTPFSVCCIIYACFVFFQTVLGNFKHKIQVYLLNFRFLTEFCLPIPLKSGVH